MAADRGSDRGEAEELHRARGRAGPDRGRRDRADAAARGVADPARRSAAGRQPGRDPAGELGARGGRRPWPGRAADRPGPRLARGLAPMDEYAEGFDPYKATACLPFRISDDIAAITADLIH